MRGCDLADHVGICHVLKRACAPLHAQVLEPVFGQHLDRRWSIRRVMRLNAGDASGEHRTIRTWRTELDREDLTKVQDLPVKIQEVYLTVFRPPVDKVCLTPK